MITVGLLAAGVGVGSLVHRGGPAPERSTASASAAAAPPAASTPPTPPLPAGGTLAAQVARLQETVRTRPTDKVALAALGLAYVQQAKVTVDPSYYPKAQAVLARSLRVDSTRNFAAAAGQAALKAAQHDFAGARSWALRGLAIDPYNATLYGSLTDAETQLGHYPAAFAAAQKMLDLKPGLASFTRAEYVFELRGQVPQAREVLARALAAAQDPSDKAFVHQTLAELAQSNGDPRAALREAEAGLAADPSYSSLLQSRARAQAALGRTAEAVRSYDEAVRAAPQPAYLVEYGEYLDSLGRRAEAAQQYALFDAENRLFTSNGVTLDTDPTLYYADHGDPRRALRYGVAGLRIRPFVEMQDAYAWALHANGRDREALPYVRRAASLGTRNALFAYHAGVIRHAVGDDRGAVSSLRRALAIDAFFSPLHAPRARALLAGLT